MDMRITYPHAIIGPVPSNVWISQVIRMGQAKDKEFAATESSTPEVIMRMVHSENYLRDVVACFSAPLEVGVKEYSVAPDYMVRMEQLVRLVKQMVLEKQCGTPAHGSDVGEQTEMDFTLRHLPTVSEVLNIPNLHQPIKLYDVLAAQYDRIAHSRQRD
jgi:hypothetical protein